MQLTTGHRISAAFGNTPCTDIDDATRHWAIGAVTATYRNHVGFNCTRTCAQGHRIGA
ncbi:hypothetical protein D3C71_2160910 [compost metagenome]